MASRTLNAKTDLTYEEIYEGYANGKSRLPKIIKQIENGAVALAETTGVNILRRRTDGGNAQTPGTVGQDSTTVVAKLISAARWDALIAGYSGTGGGYVTPPGYKLQTVNVRQVVKEPFDLIDQVAGINYARQNAGAASETRALSGREAKIQEFGTGVRIREIDTRAPAGATADIDVRDFFTNDRIGGGGATGEVHGVDQNIPNILVADSEGRAVGNTAGQGSGTDFDLTSATALNFKMGATGETEIAVVFEAKSTWLIADVRTAINAAVDAAQIANPAAPEFKGRPANDPVCNIVNGALELHTRKRGLEGEDESGIQITNDNTELGFTSADDVLRGATVGDVDGIFEQTVIDLASEASACRTLVRYGTAQFGVLQVVGTTNGLTTATASAYIVHPDFLEDLIAYQ
jgi:hypothetical protein